MLQAFQQDFDALNLGSLPRAGDLPAAPHHNVWLNPSKRVSNETTAGSDKYAADVACIGVADASILAVCLSNVQRQSRKLSKLKKQRKAAQERHVDADLALDRQRRRLEGAIRGEHRHRAAEVAERIAEPQLFVQNCPNILDDLLSSISAVETGLRGSRKRWKTKPKEFSNPSLWVMKKRMRTRCM